MASLSSDAPATLASYLNRGVHYRVRTALRQYGNASTTSRRGISSVQWWLRRRQQISLLTCVHLFQTKCLLHLCISFKRGANFDLLLIRQIVTPIFVSLMQSLQSPSPTRFGFLFLRLRTMTRRVNRRLGRVYGWLSPIPFLVENIHFTEAHVFK